MGKKIKLGCFLLIMLLVSGCGKQEKEWTREISSMSSLKLVEQDSIQKGICYVYPKGKEDADLPYVIANQYIVEVQTEEWSPIYGKYPRYFETETAAFQLNVYDLEQRLLYSYTLEDFYELCPVRGRLRAWFYEQYGDKTYIIVQLQEATTKSILFMDEESSQALWHKFYIDPENGKLWLADEKDEQRLNQLKEDNREYKRSVSILKNDAFLRANGYKSDLFPEEEKGKWLFSTMYEERDCVEVVTETACLPESGRLYERFPGLKAWQGKPGYYVELQFLDRPEAEELMKLFLEEGGEISFDGVWVTEEESVDGKPHAISSFEDFNRWYALKDERGNSDEQESMETVD